MIDFEKLPSLDGVCFEVEDLPASIKEEVFQSLEHVGWCLDRARCVPDTANSNGINYRMRLIEEAIKWQLRSSQVLDSHQTNRRNDGYRVEDYGFYKLHNRLSVEADIMMPTLYHAEEMHISDPRKNMVYLASWGSTRRTLSHLRAVNKTDEVFNQLGGFRKVTRQPTINQNAMTIAARDVVGVMDDILYNGENSGEYFEMANNLVEKLKQSFCFEEVFDQFYIGQIAYYAHNPRVGALKTIVNWETWRMLKQWEENIPINLDRALLDRTNLMAKALLEQLMADDF